MISRRCVVFGLAGLLAAGLMIGCGDPQAATNFSDMRVVNALVGAPNGSAVDVDISHGYQPVTNLPFGGVSSFQNGRLGEADFTVRSANTQNVLVPANTVTLQTGKAQTVAIAGVVGGQGALAPRLFRFLEDTIPANFVPAQTGTAQPDNITFAVRVYNLSPDSGPINLEPSALGLTNVSYGSASDYIIVTAPADRGPDPNDPAKMISLGRATIDFAFRETATGNLIPRTGAALFVVVPGNVVNVFAVGLRNPGPGQQGFTVEVVPITNPIPQTTTTTQTGARSQPRELHLTR
ncbi:MAG TPA: DUF4397 domain-containing protein [Chthonomonadaceae bacterium]|nr:DUF4397 domain-containing protein [Chthonomonadaceae bacterium]